MLASCELTEISGAEPEAPFEHFREGVEIGIADHRGDVADAQIVVAEKYVAWFIRTWMRY